MDVGSVVNQGLIGMQTSQASMLQSAQQIARAGTAQPTPANQPAPQASQEQDLVEPLVNLRVQAQVFDANAKVVKTAEETIGTLLDVKA
ncbi:hypothetical protein [Cellvibrio japonicus]|uniref:Flagellar basal-body/hook protein C-terminal domain-containing protein n=1 Tax=Cellvibrio japonicus (strain Ueda107) TaxID=498211 RepID=B3PI92_CELJU|nr:hypothetical protein [Cellvibrio japonicus]ACE85275.1 Domain of unknown function (DUF1078) family [Cellvibrio japonicus Ueda107]QEI11134.1 hypothetical protein FY117_02080 [Cellvibrio japonicus]QEI14708.1 hypothetical protein FY116_02080 [Cellvibrio japonicus]QEI18288.1 hypothetical protein FY115_02080 [Cellvibrio japonicus]